MVQLMNGLEIELIRVLQISMSITAALFLIQAVRFHRLLVAKKRTEEIERKMIAEHATEQAAEEEVKEEEKVESIDTKTGQLAIDEFVVLREIKREIKEAPVDLKWWDRAKHTLKGFHRGAKIEKKLSQRLKPLYFEAEKMIQHEPQKREAVNRELAAIIESEKTLKELMGKSGQFDRTFNRPLDASFTMEQKKEILLAIVNEAIKYDEMLVQAAKNLFQTAKA